MNDAVAMQKEKDIDAAQLVVAEGDLVNGEERYGYGYQNE